jgi:outer membrane protein TolC
VLGLDAGTVRHLGGELLEKQFEAPGTAELVRLALEHRADYAAVREAGLAARQGVRGARGQVLPRVDAFGAYGWSGEDFLGGSSDYTLGVSVTLNVFDPGRGARVSQARAHESMAQAEAEALAQQVQLEVVRAQQQFVSARDRLALSARAVSQATEALRIVQDRYQAGLITITEVLRAQTACSRRVAARCRPGTTTTSATRVCCWPAAGSRTSSRSSRRQE